MTVETLTWSQERRPNADKFWRVSRYHKESCLVANQLMDCSLTHFRDQTKPGIIIGTDHGKEVWNSTVDIIVYDQPFMLDVARVNARINNRSAEYRLLDDFKPEPTHWLKISDNQIVYDLLKDYQDWLHSIPVIYMQKNYLIKTKVDWSSILGEKREFGRSTFQIFRRGYDYGNEEKKEKGRK